MIQEMAAMFKVSEFAEKAGVTVRTLHHYDRLGLLKPSEHNRAGYRLYGERDLVRLQQIATLKFIGLSLKQIKDVLDGHDLDLLGSGRTPDWTALKKIIEVMEMQTNNEWMKKYYSDEAQAKIGQKAANFTPEMQAQVTQQWNQLIREVENAISSKQNPAGTGARELAERWAGMTRGFTGGDPEIQKGLNKLYADQANWPATLQKPFSDDVWNFIRQAMTAHGISCP
jgi:MerR family transcriptional regulator, thiopeptide resistance regulator